MKKQTIRRQWILIGGILVGLGIYGIGGQIYCKCKACREAKKSYTLTQPLAAGLIGERYHNEPSGEVEAAIEQLKAHPYQEKDPYLQGLQLLPILGTNRLVLRGIRGTDREALTKCFSDYNTIYMLVFMPWPFGEDKVRNYMRNLAYRTDQGDSLYWAITEPKQDKLLGVVGLTLEHKHDRAEIHFWMDKDARGKGYMTEAAKRVVDYVFRDLGMHRLDVNCLRKNIQCKRVLEKCGFRYECNKEDFVKKEGKYEDLEYFRILRDEYMQDPSSFEK